MGGKVREEVVAEAGERAKGGSLGMRGDLGEGGATASLVSANAV